MLEAGLAAFEDAEDVAAGDVVGGGEGAGGDAGGVEARDLAIAGADAHAVGGAGLVVLAAGEGAAQAAGEDLAAGVVVVVGAFGQEVDGDAGERSSGARETSVRTCL